MLLNIAIIIFSVTLSSIAHVLLKKGMIHTNITNIDLLSNQFLLSVIANHWLIGGIFLHICALFVWLLALSRVDITFAYPFLALGYVLVLVMARFFLGEDLNYTKLLATSIIMLGIIILSFSKN